MTIPRAQVVDLLEILEIENIKPLGKNEFLYSCPFTNGHAFGDAHPSACMNEEKQVFQCHACKARGTVFDFVKQVKACSHIEALRFLRERYGEDFREPHGGALSFEANSIMRSWNERDISVARRRPAGNCFSCVWSDHSRGHIDYMFERGFTSKEMSDWGLGYDHSSRRITIPVNDENGELVGFKGRAWEKDNWPKYKILGGGHYGFDPYEVSKVVFGLDRTEGSGKLIVVEGELDAIALHQYDLTNSVALGSSNISKYHLRLLRWHADEIVVFFDNDEAGEGGATNLCMELSLWMPVYIVNEHKGDPAELSASQCLELIENARSWTDYIAQLV